jgi:hypothetical protein
MAAFAGLASTDMIGRGYLLNRAAQIGGFRKRWSGKTDRAINAALGHFLARQVVKQREKDKQLRARGSCQSDAKPSSTNSSLTNSG